jgi:hypothetical protein
MTTKKTHYLTTRKAGPKKPAFLFPLNLVNELPLGPGSKWGIYALFWSNCIMVKQGPQ